MKNLNYLLIILSLCLSPMNGLAQKKTSSKKAAPKAKITSAPAKSAAPVKSPRMTADRQLSEAIDMVRSGDHERALIQLYALSKRGDMASKQAQIKYYTGVSLMELKLNQAAAFQFVTVIKTGGPLVKSSIEKLSLLADQLGDDTLLNYAVSKAELSSFPDQYRDIIYYRLGEIKMKNKSFGDALKLFEKVPSNSRYHSQAEFNTGFALLEAKDPEGAARIFKRLVNKRAKFPATDDIKVSAQIALARSYYQAKDWENALAAYRNVPRDHVYWHDALFESSWAYMRSAKFRSALSNFQSLHSDYYENFYQPESLLLRSIVYLYICKYDEMEKVLSIYDKSYEKNLPTVLRYARSNNYDEIYQEVAKAFVARTKEGAVNTKIPFNMLRHIALQGDVKRSLLYLNRIIDEKKLFGTYTTLSRSSMGRYIQGILNNRIKNTQKSIGEMSRNHLINVANEIKDYNEQAAFIRFEMITGQKDAMKKKIAGKALPTTIDEKIDRTFYVQNGYDYWPFEGEYWLDEIGNYQYLGQQSCE